MMTRLAGLVTNSLVRALSWLYTLGLGWGDMSAVRATDPLYDPDHTDDDTPLDPRDVDLWGRQFMEADTDTILLAARTGR